MTNGATPASINEALVLQKAPSGSYIPPAPAVPGALPLGDAFAVLNPFMDSPALRLGRRGSALNLTVDLMLEMQHDELIALLKGYQAALLVNADYEIKCADPQKQRFFEAMYRNVHRHLMLSCSPALCFGFQAMIKVFGFGIPSTDDTVPVWTDTAEPLILKKVKQIHPELARPLWDDDGSFNGIRIKGMDMPIPPLYSLWLTIGKHHVFGDYYGWGRFRAAYFPWWKKQFTDDQETLYIQKGIDPVAKVGHPEGSTDGILNSVIAANVGEAVRAGSTVTIPSTPYATKNGEGFDQQLGGLPKWTLDYIINTADIAPFLNILSRLDRQIAMAMLVPPQAVLEAKSLGLGGPNTAEILGTVAEETLMQDASEIDDHLNQYVFPFLSNANYGPDSPPVTKVTTGLSGKSKASLQTVWEKLADKETTDTTIIDFRGITEALDIPIKRDDVIMREQQERAAADATAAEVATAQARAAEAQAAAAGANPGAPAIAPAAPTAAPPTPGAPAAPPTPGGFSLQFSEEALEEEEEIELDQPDLTEEQEQRLHDAMLRLLEGEDDDPQAFSLSYQFADSPKGKRSYWDALSKVQNATQDKINRQIRAWENGNPPYDTTKRIASILREGALQAAQLGRLERGQEGALSKQEQAAVRSYMNEQKRYLKGVNRYMRQTLDKHPVPKNASPEERAARDAQARQAITHAADTLKGWRMPLYVNSLQGVYEQARARFSLSKYPRSGDTACLMNCYCKLEWGEDDQGAFVSWILGQPKEEHCSDCPELAAGSPYREGEL